MPGLKTGGSDAHFVCILILLLSIIALPISNAVTIGPHIYEQQNNGDNILPELTYSISVDCTAAAINVIVMDNATNPVQDANIYLKYVDFSSPTIGSGKTDKDGFVIMKLPGNVQLMRGLFIMVIEKKGFRNKEIHFDITNCLTNTSWVPPPIPPPAPKPNNTYTPPPVQNQTTGNNNHGNASTNNSNVSSNQSIGKGSENELSDIISRITGVIPENAPMFCGGLLVLAAVITIMLAIIWGALSENKKPWKKNLKKQKKEIEEKNSETGIEAKKEGEKEPEEI
jgi:hypothetical protein